MSRTATTSRRRRQWVLLWLAVLVLVLGWRVPALGFLVPATMLAGMIGGLFAGRWVCGNLCPRGAFFDRLIAPLGRGRPVPAWLKRMPVRWALLAGLMGFMVYRISRDAGDWSHWGRVFWMMCLITTAVGVVGGIVYHGRFWCTFCPVGTFANAVGGGRRRPVIAPACRACGACAPACPMKIDVAACREDGAVTDRDCLRCGECTSACPFGAVTPARAAG
ncbi:MAG: 4Fe-4S binding protein [Planctomycetes bacterium]|nr:4Fe-4S binding protein [Planctomycetota bacterium]